MTGPVFNAGAIEAHAKIDRSEFIRDLRSMQSDIARFTRDPIKLKGKIDRDALRADLAKLKNDLSGGQLKLVLSLNTAQAKRDITAFNAYVRNLSPSTLRVGASFAQARRDVAAYRQSIRNLAPTNLRVVVNVNSLKALAQLNQVDNAAQNLNGKTAHVNVAIGSDAGRVIGMIGLVVAGISSIAYLAPVATAAVGGLFAALGAGAQTVGALGFGLSGVGDAYKAMSQDAKTSATQVGKAHTGVDSSLRSLENTYRTSKHAIEDAERSAARTAVTSLRSVQDAERGLARAQESARQAQQDLNRARQQEISDLEELDLRLRDTAISEEEAAIALAEAQNELAALRSKPGVSELEMRKAETAVRRAQLAVDQSKKSYEDTAEEAEKAARVGVEGSDQVVAAKEREVEANRAIKDAERDLSEARDDAAYANAQAAKALSDAHENAAISIANALASVKDAQASAANSGVAQANRLEYAFSQLSPEAREFAHILYDEVRPGLNSISDATAKTMLPQMGEAMRRLLTLQPEFRTGFSETGDVIGKLSLAGANMMTSGPWRRDFATIMHGNNVVLRDLGIAGLFVTDSMRSIYVTSLPLTQSFTRAAAQSAMLFDEWVEGKRASGELAQYMDLAAQRAKELWDLFVNLITTAYDLGVALAPVGATVLDIANGFLSLIQWISEASPELLQFIAYATLAFAAFTNLGKAILGIGSATRLGIAGFSRVTTLIESASLAAGTYTERLTGSANAGQKVADTGSKVSNTLNRVGNALPWVGAALVGLSLAYDSLVISSDAAAESILQGGIAAEKANESLETQTTINTALHSIWVQMIPVVGSFAAMLADYVSPGADQAAESVRALRDQMTPLQRAQSDVTRATNDYALALDRYGPNSWQAANASAALAIETEKLKSEQQKAADATKSLLDRLAEQRDVILGTINAQISYEQSIDDIAKALTENGKTVDIHSESGRNNLRVLADLTRNGLSYIEQLQQQGATTESVTVTQIELKDRLYDAAIQLGMTKEEARRYVDQLNLVPNDVVTNFNANTVTAWDQINKFIVDTKNAIATFQDGNVTVKFWADTGNILDQAVPRAHGGPIFGRGTETSDSIPARLSHNEHVWTAREVRGAGGHQAVSGLRRQAASGKLAGMGFAEGGPVLFGNVLTNLHSATAPAQEKYTDAITEYVKNYYTATAMGPDPGAGVERWRSVSLQALSIAGQASANVNRLLMQMGTESGGNPTIVNKWDSNWQKGTPSVGLMQVIGPTYRAYRHPNFDVGPYSYGTSVNPLANILSSIRYTLSRYGSLANGWKGHGYDVGGIWQHGSMGWNLSGKPERILSPAQTVSFDRLVALLSSWSAKNIFADGEWLTNARHTASNVSSNLSSALSGSAGSSTPAIGTVIMQIPYGASPKDYVEHLDFELQYRRKKGVFSR